MSDFYIMRKDTPVCEFRVENVSENKVGIELVEVFDEKRLPLEMQFEPNIAHYLVRRLAPLIYGSLGYSIHRNGIPLAASLDDIIDYTGGLSLIDDFWLLRKDDKTKNWSDCNLFSNEISEIVSDIAFTGEGTLNVTEFLRSPDFTTDGMVDKAWRQKDGAAYLYKSTHSWKAEYGTEQYSEFYAAQIAEKLGMNYVSYDLEMWKGRLCSVCGLFTSENLSYVAGQSISFDVDSFIRSLDRNSRLYQELADIVLFDALVVNSRHLGNFGFIQDNETFDIVGLSPIFDNGMALFGDVPTRELTKPACKLIYYVVCNRRFARARSEDVKALLTDRQRSLAKEMRDFKFRKHSEYNLHEERLELLEAIIHSRAGFLSKP